MIFRQFKKVSLPRSCSHKPYGGGPRCKKPAHYNPITDERSRVLHSYNYLCEDCVVSYYSKLVAAYKPLLFPSN